MYCTKCGSLLKLKTPVCPVCNSPLDTAIKSNTSDSFVLAKPIKRRHHYISNRIIFHALLTLFIATAVLGIFSQAKANNLTAEATAYSDASDYDKAVALYEQANEYWSFPSTKQTINWLLAKNKAWQTYKSDLEKAEALFDKQDLNGALQILNDIPDDFPLYIRVSKLTSSISSSLAQKATESRKKSGAVKDTAEEIAKRTTTVTVPALSGKRYADTAMMSEIATATSLTQVEESLNVFLEQYGATGHITVIHEPSYGDEVGWSLLEPTDLKTMQILGITFISEWSKYPTGFMKKVKITRINFVKEVNAHGLTLTAYPGNNTSGSIMYGTGVNGHIIHHEFAHYLHGMYPVSASINQSSWINSWNIKGFKYGASGADAYSAEAKYAQYEHPIEGLVTEYASYGYIEDIAEMHGYMMESDEYHRLKGWISGGDGYLSYKKAAYKAYLGSLSPEMSDWDYFDEINFK